MTRLEKIVKQIQNKPIVSHIIGLVLYSLYIISYLLFSSYFSGYAAFSIVPITFMVFVNRKNAYILAIINYPISTILIYLEKNSWNEALRLSFLPLTAILLLTFLLGRNVKLREEKKKIIDELELKIEEIQNLRLLLPICSYCKKIRDDRGYWNQLESYLLDHAGLDFSHGICPSCSRKLLSEDLEKKD